MEASAFLSGESVCEGLVSEAQYLALSPTVSWRELQRPPVPVPRSCANRAPFTVSVLSDSSALQPNEIICKVETTIDAPPISLFEVLFARPLMEDTNIFMCTLSPRIRSFTVVERIDLRKAVINMTYASHFFSGARLTTRTLLVSLGADEEKNVYTLAIRSILLNEPQRAFYNKANPCAHMCDWWQCELVAPSGLTISPVKDHPEKSKMTFILHYYNTMKECVDRTLYSGLEIGLLCDDIFWYLQNITHTIPPEMPQQYPVDLVRSADWTFITGQEWNGWKLLFRDRGISFLQKSLEPDVILARGGLEFSGDASTTMQFLMGKHPLLEYFCHTDAVLEANDDYTLCLVKKRFCVPSRLGGLTESYVRVFSRVGIEGTSHVYMQSETGPGDIPIENCREPYFLPSCTHLYRISENRFAMLFSLCIRVPSLTVNRSLSLLATKQKNTVDTTSVLATVVSAIMLSFEQAGIHMMMPDMMLSPDKEIEATFKRISSVVSNSIRNPYLSPEPTFENLNLFNIPPSANLHNNVKILDIHRIIEKAKRNVLTTVPTQMLILVSCHDPFLFSKSKNPIGDIISLPVRSRAKRSLQDREASPAEAGVFLDSQSDVSSVPTDTEMIPRFEERNYFHLTDMPPEVISCITSFLDMRSVIALMNTCKSLHSHITNDKFLWDRLYRDQVKLPPPMDATGNNMKKLLEQHMRVRRNKALGKFNICTLDQGHTSSVRSLVLSTPFNALFSGGSDRKIKMWAYSEERSTFENTLTLSGPNAGIIGMDFLYPEGTTQAPILFSGFRNGIVKLWVPERLDSQSFQSAENWETVHEVDLQHSIEGITFAHPYMVFWDVDAYVWDENRSMPVMTISGHSKKITSVELWPTASNFWAVTASHDKTVRLWDFRVPETGAECSSVNCSNSSLILRGHNAGINTIECFGQTYIASASNDRTLRIWDIRMPNDPITSLAGHVSPVRVLHCDHECLYSGSDDHSIRVWSLSNFQQIGKFEAHSSPISAICSNEKFVVGASSDGTIKLFDFSI